jgi:hypothetical protein
MACLETGKSGGLPSPAKYLDTPQNARLLDRRKVHVQTREKCGPGAARVGEHDG